MKIAIIGSGSSIDNEIYIIRELQSRGVDFKYFFRTRNLFGPLFRLEKAYPNGIIPATEIREMQVFKYYIDLNNVYMISGYELRYRNPKTLWLYLQVFFKLLRYNPDVIHFTWPQIRTPALLYLLPKKIVMTVHDPIPHSSHNDKVIEKYRRLGFKRANRLILLNNRMTKDFCLRYDAPEKKIRYSQLGVYDYLDNYPSSISKDRGKYILFLGQISSYKGVDLLMLAMKDVHLKHPDWKLVVAGSGNFYFDITEYEHLNYIEIRNYFIDMPEMVGLIRGCEFVVAPYRDATQSGILYNALSLNKPVVATNVGNFSDVVTNEIIGMVVPPNDINSLSKAMNLMIEHPELRQQMSVAIKKEWRDRNNNSFIVDNLINVYKELL